LHKGAISTGNIQAAPTAQKAQTVLSVFASFDSVRVGHGHSKGIRRRKFPTLHAQFAEISIPFRNSPFSRPMPMARSTQSTLVV
jgi:hypothetical protein